MYCSSATCTCVHVLCPCSHRTCVFQVLSVFRRCKYLCAICSIMPQSRHKTWVASSVSSIISSHKAVRIWACSCPLCSLCLRVNEPHVHMFMLSSAWQILFCFWIPLSSHKVFADLPGVHIK